MRPQQQMVEVLCFAVVCPAVRLSSVRPVSVRCLYVT